MFVVVWQTRNQDGPLNPMEVVGCSRDRGDALTSATYHAFQESGELQNIGAPWEIGKADEDPDTFVIRAGDYEHSYYRIFEVNP